MSYIRADEILPREMLERIQQYADGQLLYIPCREKQEWESGTNAKAFFRHRDIRIYQAFLAGKRIEDLARCFSLPEKSIQRILRKQRLAPAAGAEESREEQLGAMNNSMT